MFLLRMLMLTFAALWLLTGHANGNDLIAGIHNNPPSPCVSKPAGKMASGVRNFPHGQTREQVRGVMGWMGSHFLASGAEYMTSKFIDVVYTSMYFQDKPINEVGIYGYEFNIFIDENMFQANEELQNRGRIMVIGNHLLLLLWHEKRAQECYAAMEVRLEEIR
jgi:hypothetical protein